VAHDWGGLVGFRFVMKHMEMIEKYVMIGTVPTEVWHKLITGSLKQFMMSWYIFYFQCPLLPEFTISMSDFKGFSIMKNSEEDSEAYKYTFGQKGALTGPINYYRAVAGLKLLFPDPPLPRVTRFAPGLFMLGEGDKYISRESGPMAQQMIQNLQFKVIKGANHFAQQHAPAETNRLIREFLNEK